MGLPGFETMPPLDLVHEEGASRRFSCCRRGLDAQVAFSITIPALLGVNLGSASATKVAIIKLASLGRHPLFAVVCARKKAAAANPIHRPACELRRPLVISVGDAWSLQKVINRLGCEIALCAPG